MIGEVEIRGERLLLRPDRSLFWPREKMLVIADPHFGKADAFRSAGVPVPGDATEPLERLADALRETTAERLVILGDFWHARGGRTAAVLAALEEWRCARPGLRIDLVRGNHDRAGPPPESWGAWCEEIVEPPFSFTHHPDESKEHYVIAGHLHPGLVFGRERLRLACFWFRPHVGVLPAFGPFTGAATVPIRRGDRVFALADGEVIDVTRH